MASLQELPDDELDKLFRSSAEEFEPPYNSEDWNSLRQRLDDDDRSRFIYRFVYWGLPLLLLLLTTVSLVIQPENVRPTAKKPATHQQAVSTNEVTKTGTSKTGVPSGNVATGSVSAESSPPDASPERTGQPVTTTNTEVNAKTVDENRETKKPQEELASLDATAKTRPGSIASSSKPVASTDKPIESSSSGKAVEKTTIPQKISARSLPKNRLKKPVSGENNRFGSTGYVNPSGLSKNRNAKPVSGLGTPTSSDAAVTGEPTAVQSNEPPVLTSETETFDLRGNLNFIATRAPKKKPLPTLPTLPELDLEPMLPPVGPKIVPPTIPIIGYPSLSVRFIMAPDFNFVGTSNKASKDLEIGVVGEYRFARRFTIQSGILRSVKRYTASADSYAKPMHWYGPKYESVGAVCTVLDIPINLRFDVMLNERRRWFISSGFSSYIMQKESYEYNYPAGTPAPSMLQYQRWSGKTGFHEWSHLNFSLGYERNFRSDGPLRRFSWQVEPFLKYARRETLGYGKIRLTSTGVFFSLRYRL